MGTRIRMGALVVALLSLCAMGCWNGGQSTLNGGSNRLMLVIEPNRTDTDGTHFLVDTMNGDLWRLDATHSQARWVRLADGPKDLAEFELPEVAPAGA